MWLSFLFPSELKVISPSCNYVSKKVLPCVCESIQTCECEDNVILVEVSEWL